MYLRFSPEFEDWLRVAAWYPRRRIADEELERLDEEKPLFLHEQRAIEEFGGIYVEAWGEWRSSSNYRRSFCIDPRPLMGDEELNRLEGIMKRRLYPLGYIDYSIEPLGKGVRVIGEYALFIDEYGCVFAFDCFTCARQLMIGLTIDHALNNLGTEKGFRWWVFAHDIPLEAPYIFTDWWT